MLLILLAFFSVVAGVLGIVLLWIKSTFKVWTKAIITVVGLLIVVYTGLWTYLSSSNLIFSTIVPNYYYNKYFCEESGGYITTGGLAGNTICVHEYDDGGNMCTSSDQCQGSCRVGISQFEDEKTLIGRCDSDDNSYGCFGATIEDCKKGNCQGLCID